MKIIEKALKEEQTALSEYESKQILASYGIPVTKELNYLSMMSKVSLKRPRKSVTHSF